MYLGVWLNKWPIWAIKVHSYLGHLKICRVYLRIVPQWVKKVGCSFTEPHPHSWVENCSCGLIRRRPPGSLAVGELICRWPPRGACVCGHVAGLKHCQGCCRLIGSVSWEKGALERHIADEEGVHRLGADLVPADPGTAPRTGFLPALGKLGEVQWGEDKGEKDRKHKKVVNHD
jgi:hypothetical protein